MVIHSDYPYPVRTLTLDEGQKIAYVQVGSGSKMLLFVHGFAGFLPIWERNIERLQKYFTCIALDLPGHGLSSSGDYPFTMEFYAQTIQSFIQKLGLEEVSLVGHSMGGQISVRLALMNPTLISELVLIAPAGFETFDASERFFLSNMISSSVFNTAQYFKHWFNLKDFFFDLDEKEYAKLQEFSRDFYSLTGNPNLLKVLVRSSQSMLNHPVFDELKLLQMPVLVCFGKQDKLIPNPLTNHESTQKIAERAVAQIPNCILRLYDKGGHFLQYEEAASINIEMYKFLKPETFT
jgi:pimeloyl-ACP methyl ester carboxylesterase